MKNKKYQFVIFGGTGDLSHRKLLPAFYDLLAADLLPDDYSLIALGRRNDNRAEYLNDIYTSIKKRVRHDFKEELWNELKSSIKYLHLDITKSSDYKQLKELLEQEQAQRIFYLALAPKFFASVVEKLAKQNLVENYVGKSRLVIEKPFGKDLSSAKDLNKKIRKVYDEEDIYRIDHYLGKEMLQNISVIRFGNLFFEALWNSEYIDNVQIISSESVGIGQRGEYYDKAGALRDMLQNHMLQLLTVTAMEPPAELEADLIRTEKVKVLKALTRIDAGNIDQLAVRGQYNSGRVGQEEIPAYREEEGVADDSVTETFTAFKLKIDNQRWSGVPFYIKTGKCLPEKLTQITIEFKKKGYSNYDKFSSELEPNLLVIRIQPLEGIYLRFNAKKPGAEEKIIPVDMDFCQNCSVDINTAGAYEKLIKDLFVGDSTLFTRWDEVEAAWKFIDQISKAWANTTPDFPNYKPGSQGPTAADKLLEKDGRQWWDSELSW